MADQFLYFLNSLLRRHTVEQMTGDSRTTIYRKVKRKLLTPPVQIGGGRVAWPQSEIVAINKACVFRTKAATYSSRMLPPIPFQSCHLFR
jgi:predicted DNA-binding transcriptional regulator AlpA